ncbi:MAG: lipid A deacylase LpxR family protein [Acidobacteriota bacterium]
MSPRIRTAGAALFGVLALASAAGAQTSAAILPCYAPNKDLSLRTSILAFQLENDLFAGTDAEYTSGAKLTWVSPNIEGFDSPLLPAWVRCSNERVRDVVRWFLPPGATARNMVVTLGQAMYTPADRDRASVDPGDRPYAGWTYLGLGYNVRFDPDPDLRLRTTSTAILNTLEIDLGIVGPHSYAKQSQDLIHRMRGIPRFLGWDHQLQDEPGLQIVWEQKFRPRTLSSEKEIDAGGGFAVEAIPHYGISMGNVASYVNVGAEVRFGWRLPDDFGTASIRPGGGSAAPRSATQLACVYCQHSFHFFASFDGRAVANNIFLDGNTFKRSHAIKKKLLVGDIAYGWAYTWPKNPSFPGGKLAYVHYVQSREFEGEGRNHGFGSVSVSIDF